MKQMLSYRTVLLAQTGICSRDSSGGSEEYTTSINGFINKCIDDVVPTVTVRTYHNQKPWIKGNIRTELKARAATFKERESNPESYKKSCYANHQTGKASIQVSRPDLRNPYYSLCLVRSGCD